MQHPKGFPPQQQGVNPGAEHEMNPQPMFQAADYKGSGKLQDKVAIITGADSGIGRSVAILFAREGANVSIIYHEQHEDAKKTKEFVEKEGRSCLLIAGDVKMKSFCQEAVEKTVQQFGKLDILVNHAGVQWVKENLEDISEEQLDITFRTNVYSYFFMSQAALKHLKEGSSIINTTSINAYKGHPNLIDYSSTKGANLAFIRSLSQNLASKGIRVNGVAPGPIWTPFIPSSFPAEKVKTFGTDTPLGRAGQPEECAPSYVFLASNCDSSYFTGQVLHPNGGYVINT